MKQLIIGTITALIASTALADSEFYLGAGAFSAEVDYCTGCDIDGWMIEAGQEMNRFIAVEAKFGRGDLDDRRGSASSAFIGANLSPGVLPDWVDVYGKLGAAWTNMETSIFEGFSEDGDPSYDTLHHDFAFAYGLGVRMSLAGWYGRIEALNATFESEDILNTTVSFGFRF